MGPKSLHFNEHLGDADAAGPLPTLRVAGNTGRSCICFTGLLKQNTANWATPRPCCLKTHHFIVLKKKKKQESKAKQTPKSLCLQAWFLLGALGGNPSQAPSPIF